MSEMHDIQADLVIALQTLDISGFKEVFQKSNIDLSHLQDHNKTTIFHELGKSCIKESMLLEFLEITISFFYRLYNEKACEKIDLLLNQLTNDENLSALHLAVRNGKLKLVKEYIRLGADPKVKTEKGHSLIHLACIQGSMPVIAYLKYEVGIDLNQRDQSGVNCLHLAAKAGNEFVVLSLIAWGCDCDTVDSNNNSPLHYAALNGNYKVVRALLQAGAKRGTNNSDGETALQIAFKNGNLDLLPILKNPSLLSRINPFKHPIKPVKNSYRLFSVYVILFIFRYMLVLLYIVPHLDFPFEVASLVIFVISMITFMMVSHSDPGYIKHKNQEPMLFLYQTFQAEFICPFCECKKPPKARHCHYCNRCVKVRLKQNYDHHCPWIRNCVGKRNHRLFIVFIVSLCVDLLYNAVIGILDYFNVITHKNVHLFKVNDYIPEAALTISGICLVSFLIAFPVCFIQITNLIKKQTTHERFAFVKSGSHLGTSTSMPSMTLIRGSEESMENIRNQEKPIKKRHKSKRCCFDSTPVEQEMLIA